MKTQLVFGIALSIFFSTINLQAALQGPSTGGGGFVVSCPATPLEPAQTVLLDLYEAEEEFNFEIMKASGSIAQDYFKSADRTYTLQGYPDLAGTLRDEINTSIKRFFRIVKFVNDTKDLPVANDFGKKPQIPSQCQLQQIAYFDDASETVFVLQSIWDKLDTLNQAALVTHEIVFRNYRSLGENDSYNARVFVAHAYSVKGPLPVNSGLLSQNKKYTIVDDGRVTSLNVSHGFRLGLTTARLQFSQIGDYAMIAKTWADISSPVWELETQYEANSERLMCIVKTPNVNHVATAPLSGTMLTNHSVTLEYITGKPLRLKVMSAEGSVLVDHFLSGCR